MREMKRFKNFSTHLFDPESCTHSILVYQLMILANKKGKE